MRIHEFLGDAICIVPIDGVPCLRLPQDREAHVQPKHQGKPSKQDKDLWLYAPEGNYLVLSDGGAWRRVPVLAYGSVEAADQAIRELREESPNVKFWIERQG